MSIYGIGTDLVSCTRISQLWHKYGQLFAKRILTAYELRVLDRLPASQIVGFLAKRFAAKEAVAKALGVGFRDELLLREVGIESDELGKPRVCFYGTSMKYWQGLGALVIHVSLSDEREFAQAFVVVELH